MSDIGKVFHKSSPCNNYVYKFWCQLSEKEKKCIFISLNPSTAVEKNINNSPTVLKCKEIARRKDCGSMILLDLFPYVGGNWQGLWDAEKQGKNILGPEGSHEKWFRDVLKKEDSLIIAAWGDVEGRPRPPKFKEAVNFYNRIDCVKRIIKEQTELDKIKCLKNSAKIEEVVSHPFWIKRIEDAELEDYPL